MVECLQKRAVTTWHQRLLIVHLKIHALFVLNSLDLFFHWLPYTEIEELMAEVNSGEEGLGGSVWGDDTEQAIALAKHFETGSTWINNHGELNPMAPFGGCKMSGLGSEFGQNALVDYTVTHSMHISK